MLRASVGSLNSSSDTVRETTRPSLLSYPPISNETKERSRSRALNAKRFKHKPLILIVVLVVATIVTVAAYLGIADRLPWGGRATSCTVKELRDTGGLSLFKSIDAVSRVSLSARDRLCSQRLGSRTNGQGSKRIEQVTVAFLIWTYKEDDDSGDLRREYATTQSEVTPRTTVECSSWCRIVEVTNRDDYSHADLIMFSPSDHGRAYGPQWCRHDYPEPFMSHVRKRLHTKRESLRRHKHEQDDDVTTHRKQYWGAWTFEHVRQFPQLADPLVLGNVDMTMNYRQDADVPVSWFCEHEAPPGMRNYSKPPPSLTSSKTILLSAVGSRCRNDWKSFVDELSTLLPPDKFVKYGGCWGYQNRIPSVHHDSFTDKILELSKSKFVLVFENTKEISDYVSEKLSHAFLANAVPVIWGAPNVEEYLPDNRSAIVVTRQGKVAMSPGALAQELLRLDGDDAAYSQFFEWRNRPLSAQFEKRKKQCFQTAGCSLCEWVQRKRQCDQDHIDENRL